MQDAELSGLVTGRGMTLNTASCLILGIEMTDKPKAAPIRPAVNDVNRPFWDGCRAGQLKVQRN